MSCRPVPSCHFLRGNSTGAQLLLIYWCVICLFKKAFTALIPGGEGRSLLCESKWSLLPDQLLLHPLFNCNPYHPSKHSLFQDFRAIKGGGKLKEANHPPSITVVAWRPNAVDSWAQSWGATRKPAPHQRSSTECFHFHSMLSPSSSQRGNDFHSADQWRLRMNYSDAFTSFP